MFASWQSYLPKLQLTFICFQQRAECILQCIRSTNVLTPCPSGTLCSLLCFYHLHENKWMIAGLQHMLYIYWVLNPYFLGSKRSGIVELRNAILFSLLCSCTEVLNSKFACISTCIGIQISENPPLSCTSQFIQYPALQCLRIHRGICENSRMVWSLRRGQKMVLGSFFFI